MSGILVLPQTVAFVSA